MAGGQSLRVALNAPTREKITMTAYISGGQSAQRTTSRTVTRSDARASTFAVRALPHVVDWQAQRVAYRSERPAAIGQQPVPRIGTQVRVIAMMCGGVPRGLLAQPNGRPYWTVGGGPSLFVLPPVSFWATPYLWHRSPGTVGRFLFPWANACRTSIGVKFVGSCPGRPPVDRGSAMFGDAAAAGCPTRRLRSRS